MNSDGRVPPPPRVDSRVLVSEPAEDVAVAGEAARLMAQVGEELAEASRGELPGWNRAREIIDLHRPVPWFIWRLCNYVFNSEQEAPPINEGMVFGLRRLLVGAASDEVLGCGRKTTSVRDALKVLHPHTVAAVAMMYSVGRKLSSFPHERIWSPILDDALLRARIGFEVGSRVSGMSAGKGMVCGFAGRAGLALLIAQGSLEEARRALELLAAGATVKSVGEEVFRCEPLQASALLLSAAGCPRASVFGVASAAVVIPAAARGVAGSDEGWLWRNQFVLIEALRTGKVEALDEETRAILGSGANRIEELRSGAKQAVRRGHGWLWLSG